jgi:lipopolysaccharide export system protein LptA
MSSYTKALTAEQLIYFIANDRPELSHEKVLWQRNEYIKVCREWLEVNKGETDE